MRLISVFSGSAVSGGAVKIHALRFNFGHLYWRAVTAVKIKLELECG